MQQAACGHPELSKYQWTYARPRIDESREAQCCAQIASLTSRVLAYETTSLTGEKVVHSACLSALSEECELCLAYFRGVRPIVAHGFEQLFFVL